MGEPAFYVCTACGRHWERMELKMGGNAPRVCPHCNAPSDKQKTDEEKERQYIGQVYAPLVASVVAERASDLENRSKEDVSVARELGATEWFTGLDDGNRNYLLSALRAVRKHSEREGNWLVQCPILFSSLIDGLERDDKVAETRTNSRKVPCP